jgi:hypothetical protein
VVTNRKLRQFIDTHTSIHDLAHAKVPTYLVAADLLSGRDVLISTGDLATGVLAFPPRPACCRPRNMLVRSSSTGRSPLTPASHSPSPGRLDCLHASYRRRLRPAPSAGPRSGGQGHRRPMGAAGGGAAVVVRGRESRPHGEGRQRHRNCRGWAGWARPGGRR